jgi:hypothetical protein
MRFAFLAVDVRWGRTNSFDQASASNSIKRTWCRTLSQPSFENYSGSQDLFLLLEITLSEFFPLPEGLPRAW